MGGHLGRPCGGGLRRGGAPRLRPVVRERDGPCCWCAPLRTTNSPAAHGWAGGADKANERGTCTPSGRTCAGSSQGCPKSSSAYVSSCSTFVSPCPQRVWTALAATGPATVRSNVVAPSPGSSCPRAAPGRAGAVLPLHRFLAALSDGHPSELLPDGRTNGVRSGEEGYFTRKSCRPHPTNGSLPRKTSKRATEVGAARTIDCHEPASSSGDAVLALDRQQRRRE